MSYIPNIPSLIARIFLLVLMVPGAALAEGEHLVVVDVKRIVSESLAAKHVAKQIDKKRQEYQDQVNEEEEALRKEEQELSSQRSVLAQDVFEERMKGFGQKIREVRESVDKRRGILENAYVKALSVIQEKTLAVIEDLAKERGFTAALPKSQLLYMAEGKDISNDVLEALNDSLPRLKVEIED